MPLQKMPDAAQRDALIAYLELATVDPPIDGNGPARPGLGRPRRKAMRAFIFSLIALAAITAISAAALRFVPMSASDVYSEKPNVRL